MNPASKVREVAGSASATAAPWIVSLARLGYVSTAVVYTVIGLIGLGAAFGHSRREADTSNALSVILQQPFGRVLLGIVALGLLGYAAWRFVAAANDAERDGTSPTGLASRAGGFGRGLIYFALAVEAMRMVLRNSAQPKGESHWTSRVMDMPLGRWLIVAAGAGVVIYAAYQLYRAYAAKLGSQLRLGEMPAPLRRKVIGVSRAGIAARAIVMAVLGTGVARAAWRGHVRNDESTADALAAIGQWNHWGLAAIGLGLIAYGLYQLVNARYRIIRTS